MTSAQDESGLKRILSAAPVYQAFQNLVGAQRLYRRLVREHIRPAPGLRVLDIGCGPAAILGELPDDVTYLGFDLSELYIGAARKRWGARGTFRCAPVDEVTVRDLPEVDVVLAVGVLHHLDDRDAERLFALAGSVLGATGRVITYDPCFAPRQGALSRFLVSRDRGRHVRSPDGYEALARRVFPHVTATVLEGHLRIPYTATVLCASSAPVARPGGEAATPGGREDSRQSLRQQPFRLSVWRRRRRQMGFSVGTVVMQDVIVGPSLEET